MVKPLKYRFNESGVRITNMEFWIYFLLSDFKGYDVPGIGCLVWDTDF